MFLKYWENNLKIRNIKDTNHLSNKIGLLYNLLYDGDARETTV